jgi:intracellular sulfur oxidation DsrE/DsrF family protein
MPINKLVNIKVLILGENIKVLQLQQRTLQNRKNMLQNQKVMLQNRKNVLQFCFQGKTSIFYSLYYIFSSFAIR